MPRKPKPPSMMHIEGLTTGQDASLVDEFTGEPITRPNAQVPKGFTTLKQQMAEAKLAAAQATLAKAGWPGFAKPSQPRLVAPTTPGQRSVMLNDQFAVIIPAKPWRRV